MTEEPLGRPHAKRRLWDKILTAFHQACDQNDFEVAGRLVLVLEAMMTRVPATPAANRRQIGASLVAAHERLWGLRHPSDGVKIL